MGKMYRVKNVTRIMERTVFLAPALYEIEIEIENNNVQKKNEHNIEKENKHVYGEIVHGECVIWMNRNTSKIEATRFQCNV